MQTASPVLTLSELCAILAISEATFHRRRPAMERAGFPRRLPGLARWSRRAVLRWIEASGEAAMIVGNDNGRPAFDPVMLERLALEARIG